MLMLLLAGTFLSTFRETINYGAKGDRPAGSFEKREVYVLDNQGRPHTLSLPRDFDDTSLPARGGALAVLVRPSTFGTPAQVVLNVEKVLTMEQVRETLGLPGLRAADKQAG